MALITKTAAQMRALTDHGAVIRNYDAGGSITVGDSVYIASDGDVEQAIATAQASGKAIGIAVQSYDGETTINSGDPVAVCVFGPVSGFSGMTPGNTIYQSDTAGRVADAAGTYAHEVGYAESATVLFVSPGDDDPTSPS